MTTTPEYDEILARKMKEREIKGNISSVKMTPEETAKEIADITEGVFIEPVPIIAPTGPELDVMAKTLEQFKPKRRGRPPGSKNRPKV